MTANDSSSSATSPSIDDPPSDGHGADSERSGNAYEYVELLGDRCPKAARLPPLPTAYLLGQDRDLLAPLRFLDPDGAVEALAESATPMTDRTALAEALRVANDAYGHPRAEELARKLADPRTRVVVTGQQPGLWGGPLMTLSKAVAAVRWAQALENAGVPAVAVFWVATEDHDFAESSRVSFIAPTGPETLDLGEDPDPLLPVGMRTFGPPLVSAMERAEELLGSGAAEGIQTARAFYRPNARFGEAFSRLMVKIFADRAPLFLDAMLPELKQAQAPYLERLVEARAELDAAYADRDARIQDRGHPLQVTPQPGLSPLFLLHSTQDEIGDHVQRRRIEWRADEHFGLRGSEGTWSVTELLSTIRDNPSTVSPGVLARPALQDAVLGSTLLVLGPGELSYLAQAAPGYEALGIEPPWVTLRPQSMILDTRSSSWLQELGLPLTELLDSTPEEIVARRFSEDPVGPVREEIDRALATLREQVLMIDQTLEKPWKKTQDQVHRGLEIFGGKVRNAVANRHGVWLRRAEKLHQMLRPAGSLQERKISTLFFYARYGDALARSFLEDLDLDPRKLSVIHP